MKLAERVESVCRTLAKTYPDAHCELNFTNPLELLVATMLSAQCTDVQVNIVTVELFRKYREAADYAKAAPGQLEEDIKRIGLFRNKAKNIRAACAIIEQKHGGKVPNTMEALHDLPGVGRKTANVVLGNAYGIRAGIVVDTHVGRLSQRLGLTKEENPVKIEAALTKIVPQSNWTMFSHWLIFHGRRRCKARNPDCAGCELATICPSRGAT
jgi:endonuclease III